MNIQSEEFVCTSDTIKGKYKINDQSHKDFKEKVTLQGNLEPCDYHTRKAFQEIITLQIEDHRISLRNYTFI